MSKSKMQEKEVNEEIEEVNEELNENVCDEEAEEKSDVSEKKPVEVKEEIDYQEKYLRLMAEFDNFKKRTQKESLAIYSNAVCDTVEKLLTIMDSFDRAIPTIEEDDNSNFTQGVLMIYKQLQEMLDKLEVKKIDATGQKFDPNFHNAVMHVDDDSLEENVIVEEFMKGYIYKDKVIRHSMVKVAN